MQAIIGGRVNWYGLIRAARRGTEIVIKPTLRCNLACDYCTAEHAGAACWAMPADDRPAFAWFEQFQQEIFPRHGRIRQIVVSGGEPLLYDEIVPLVRYLAVSRGIPTYIFSNLMLGTLWSLGPSRRVKIKATFHEYRMKLRREWFSRTSLIFRNRSLLVRPASK